MSPQAAEDLVRHAVAAVAYLSHAFEVALDIELAVEAEDHLVLLDQIDAAGRHGADVIWALNPEWRDVDRRSAEAKILTVFRRYAPEIDESRRGRDVLVAALRDAIAAAHDGVRAARSYGRVRRYRAVGAELEFCADHLENALYLLDTDAFVADIDATTPTDRVKLASRIEIIELELEENRELVRERGVREMGL